MGVDGDGELGFGRIGEYSLREGVLSYGMGHEVEGRKTSGGIDEVRYRMRLLFDISFDNQSHPL